MSRLGRLLFQVGTWFVYAWAVFNYRRQLLYDDVMTRWWPYDRYPEEWRSLFRIRRYKKET